MKIKSGLATIGIFAATLFAPATAQAATNYFCNEYSGDEFLISTTYSYRASPTQIQLWFQSDLPVHVIVYASGAGAVFQFDMNAHPVGGTTSPRYIVAYIQSSQPHTWSAGSYAFDTTVPNSWDSSWGYGNHCGSNSFYIHGA